MQKLINKGHLLKKIGFYRTMEILPGDGRKIKLSEFFVKLLKSDHYNTFARIKFDLLEKGIIEIDYNKNHTRYIKLTRNGVILKHDVLRLISQIEKGVKE